MDLFSADVTDAACQECGSSYARPDEAPCPVCHFPGSPGVCQGRHCNVRVRWVRTQSGALMPLDGGIQPDGNVLLEYSVLDGAWRAQVLNEYQRAHAGPVRWRAHWVTCQDADAYRDRPS